MSIWDFNSQIFKNFFSPHHPSSAPVPPTKPLKPLILLTIVGSVPNFWGNGERGMGNGEASKKKFRPPQSLRRSRLSPPPRVVGRERCGCQPSNNSLSFSTDKSTSKSFNERRPAHSTPSNLLSERDGRSAPVSQRVHVRLPSPRISHISSCVL